MCDINNRFKRLDQQPQLNISTANNVYNLPSVEDLVQHHHATAGFLVKQTWCLTISNGNYAA